MNPNLKQIAVSKQNYILLKSLGQAGDSFNDVVSRLLKNTTIASASAAARARQKTEDVS
jgi:predicted CopG family antitoxin